MQGDPKVVLHRNVDEIAGLREGWSELAASSDQPLFFQSPAWLDEVAKTRRRRGSDHWRMCIVTASRGERLVAIWPLSLQREGLCWIARCLDDPFGQFAGLVIAADDDADQTIHAMIDALKTEAGAAGLMIERLAEGTALYRSLTAKGAKNVFSDQSVHLDFRPFDDFQSYLKTRRSKTRKNLRNARNRLVRDHGAVHEVVTGAEEMRAVMAEAFEARLDWMQDQAKTAPAFRDPDFRALLDGLTEGEVQDHLIGFRLRAGDTPVSVQWGFVYGGRYYAFISARNPAFDAYSAGRVHLGMVLEGLFRTSDRGGRTDGASQRL